MRRGMQGLGRGRGVRHVSTFHGKTLLMHPGEMAAADRQCRRRAGVEGWPRCRSPMGVVMGAFRPMRCFCRQRGAAQGAG